MSDIVQIASIVVQVLIFIVAAFILPSVRNTNSELHRVQIELAMLREKMGTMDGLRITIESMRSAIHSMQIRMAAAGMWDGSEDHQQ